MSIFIAYISLNNQVSLIVEYILAANKTEQFNKNKQLKAKINN